MTSGRGKDRSDLERTNCINATRTDCGTKLWAATRHAPGLGTARVTRFTAGADEPYEGILHVRVCGGRRGQPRLLPGRERGWARSVANPDTLGRPRRSVRVIRNPNALVKPKHIVLILISLLIVAYIVSILPNFQHSNCKNQRSANCCSLSRRTGEDERIQGRSRARKNRFPLVIAVVNCSSNCRTSAVRDEPETLLHTPPSAATVSN